MPAPTCLIVDDNKVAVLTLRQLLNKTGKLSIVGECSDAVEAKNLIETKAIDILFLDIEMPGMSGMELLRLLPKEKRPLTILTTAKQGYALEAFELNVVDYLVKPIGLSRLIVSIERCLELLVSKGIEISSQSSHSSIFVKDQKAFRKIVVDEILWVEAKGDYVKIISEHKTIVVHSSLKTIEDILPDDVFLRIHRGYIVNINKIDYIEDRVAYIHGQPKPISDGNKDALLKKLNLF